MAAVSSGYNCWRRKPHGSSENRARSVPTWERKFCWEVGSVPWKKIVESKKYIDIFDRVIEWNDSACEDAFNKAKLRYWLKMTRQPQRVPLPNPDMFIDKNIDWNNAESDAAIWQSLDECLGDEEEEGEKEKENVNAVNSFDVPLHQIKPTGWDLYERKCQVLTGMVVGE